MTVHTPILDRAPRHDGWTPERKMRFLDSLAEKGNVRHACGRVGLSQQAAYVLRRRDPVFARAWAAALVLGRESCEQILADRAIDGIEEEIWYRGELVGTRRKYDARLLLAHIARLDKLVEEQAGSADMARFDELLACLGGEPCPAAIVDDADVLPLDRESAAERSGDEAYSALRHREAGEADECPGDDSDEDGWEDWRDSGEEEEWDEAFESACIAAFREGRAQGAMHWDTWFADACGYVDWAAGRLDGPALAGLPGGLPLETADETLPAPLLQRIAAVAAELSGPAAAANSSPCTRSTYSTSALARALAGPAQGFDFTPGSPFGKGAGM